MFITQLILNAKISNITKISSFFANFKKKLNLFEIFKEHKSIDAIIQKINVLKQIHENIIKIQKYFVNYQKKNDISIEKKNISQHEKFEI